MYTGDHTSHQKAARILRVACGFLFSVFSFVYLYVLQRDVMGALHYALAQGRTVYRPLLTALIITVVLLLLCWGVSRLTGLKGPARALTYFPSCLLLGVVTDIDRSIYHGGGINERWLWLLPLLLAMFVCVTIAIRYFLWRWMNRERSFLELMNINMIFLTILCLMTACIHDSDVNFHHELAIERAMAKQDYQQARQVGEKSLETTRTLSALRAYALSREGTMGDYLFAYPQPYGVDGLLPETGLEKSLRVTADSLYHYLGGERPLPAETKVDYLARICREGTGSHAALDYYLCALLLDKRLPEFMTALHTYCFDQDSLPRYYREATTLYAHTLPDYIPSARDTVAMPELRKFITRSQDEFASPLEEKNRMRREFGKTYWWYYYYQ